MSNATPDLARTVLRMDSAAASDDSRMRCTNCFHYASRNSRCKAHAAAGLSTPDVGPDFARTLQRCRALTLAIQPTGRAHWPAFTLNPHS